MSIPNPNSIPPLPYAPQVKKDSTLAIISLIAGIAGWTIIPVIGAIVAVGEVVALQAAARKIIQKVVHRRNKIKHLQINFF